MVQNVIKMAYITKSTISLTSGIGDLDLTFGRGLNFLAGENGTGKSKTLEYIKSHITEMGTTIETDNGEVIPAEKVAFYNPKRNNQKREVVGLIEQMQREGKNARTLRSLVNQNYSDQNFVEYPSLAELFTLSVDDEIRTRDTSPSDAVATISTAMSLVMERVMPDIKVDAQWNTTTNEAYMELVKNGVRLTPSHLSVGENEIISLTLSVYLFREAHDVYLIDEPEVHLNWSLEQKLFDFLKWFAEEYDKQLIVVTHSPIVLEKKFKELTQFFSWKSGKVSVSEEPSEQITDKLASRVAATFEAIETGFDKTFFVEDEAHKMVVEKLAEIKSKNVRIMPLGSRANVISMHRAVGTALKDSVFMVDGDNEDETNKGFSDGLFALERYCIENYFLDFSILAKLSKSTKYNTETKIKNLIITKTKAYSNTAFKKQYKPHIELAKVDKKRFFGLFDSIDGSLYLNGMKIYQQFGFNSKKDFIESYIQLANDTNKLDVLFKEITTRL